MSATATLAPPQPPLPPPSTSQSQILSRVGSSTSPLNKRSSDSPNSAASRTSVRDLSPSPVQQDVSRQSPSGITKGSPVPHMQSKIVGDRKTASPVPVKLPDPIQPAASPPKEQLVSPPFAKPASVTKTPTGSPNNKDTDGLFNTTSEQTPAQLALLLSQALTDADAFRQELASEKKRLARAERLLAVLQVPSPNSTTTSTEEKNSDGRLPESAAKAVLEAEARTEKAERARDEALHALAALSSGFAELERYEAACSLRASDARGAYSRLLTSLTAALPPAQASPALSTRSPRDGLKLNLPKAPAPLPSLPPANQVPGSGFNLPPQNSSVQLSRYVRPLPPHSSFVSAQSPIDTRQTNAFESLSLPAPPTASGLSSINLGVPMKRTYNHRFREEEAEYEEQKRRRLAIETDIEIAGSEVQPYASRTSSRHSNQYQSGPPSAQPLSGHPTAIQSLSAGPSPPSRIYDRSLVQYGYPSAPSPNHLREAVPPYSSVPASGSRYSLYDDRERDYSGRDREAANVGLVRMDARELAREAKARERRESYVRYPHAETHSLSESQRILQTGDRPRRRSASRGSSRSKSSMSLDEMLLETATDGQRVRPSPPEQPAAGLEARRSQNYGAQSVNGASAAQALPTSSATSQSLGRAPSTYGSAANGNGRKSSVPASQLMTLGPNGTIISGGGGGAPDAASMDPAVRFPGLRTCRQCGQPGRYKDGKCVEKWGPGPQGPGTVCDRCRKKMKRVERRGTLDSGSASLRGNHSHAQKSSQATLALAHTQPAYSQSFAQPQPQSQSSRARAPAARTDTIIVEQQERHPSNRNHTPARGSRYHASVPAASAAARHSSLSEQAHYSSHSQSQPQHHAQQSRRALTPPYITAISSREQRSAPAPGTAANTNSNSRRVAESEEDLLLEEEDDRGVNATRSAARYAHSESYARQTRGEERDELAEDADGDVDADADGSGIGSADADAEADADADIMDAVDASMKTED